MSIELAGWLIRNMIEKRYHAWPVFVLLYATATLWGLQIVWWAFK